MIMKKLMLPFGKVWLEADDQQIAFKIVNQTAIANEFAHDFDTRIEAVYQLDPIFPPKFTYHRLQLKTDYELENNDLYDYEIDEDYTGNTYLIGDMAVCGGVFHPNNRWEIQHVVHNKNTFPYYVNVSGSGRDYLSFKVAYKKWIEFWNKEKTGGDQSFIWALGC